MFFLIPVKTLFRTADDALKVVAAMLITALNSDSPRARMEYVIPLPSLIILVFPPTQRSEKQHGTMTR